MSENLDRPTTQQTATVRLVTSGAGATGAATGAVLGFMAGGPAGALVGGAAGALLQDGMREVVGQVAERFTTQSEQERIGSCLILAHEAIATRLNNGEPLRGESFFKRRARKNNTKLRSEATELLEGTFLAARDAYEERKVALLANFYANIAFDNEIDSNHANHILSLARLLTYRQLVILGIIGRLTDFSKVRDTDFRNGGSLTVMQIGVLYEVYQMVGLELITSIDSQYIMGLSDITPSKLKLQGNGAHLVNLLRPDFVDDEDKRFYFEAFKPVT